MLCSTIQLAMHQLVTEFISFTECGGAPTVTLNCSSGSAHVEWAASRPGCQFDCKAYWTCVNHTDGYHYVSHREEVTS